MRRPVGRPKENPLARPYLNKDLYYGLPVFVAGRIFCAETTPNRYQYEITFSSDPP